MGKKAKTNDNAVETCSNIVKWTPEMDEVLLDALLDEQLKGHRPNGTFSTVAYNNVVKKLTDTLNCSLNKDHIKNRTKTLKQNFNTCYELFKGMSGFAWNSSTGLFEAEPDVWNELTKANSAAAKWRNTKICHYDKLLDLFAKDRATGEGAMSAKEKVQQWNIEGSSTLNDMNDGNESEYFMNLDPISPIDTSQANSQSAASSKNGKRKASMIEVMEKQVDVIDAGISNLTSAIKEGNAIAEKGNEIAEKRNEIAEKSRPRVYTEDEIFAGLIDIGVPDNLQLDAFLFLLKSEQKIRAFFGCPRERRGELLTKMMFGSNDS